MNSLALEFFFITLPTWAFCYGLIAWLKYQAVLKPWEAKGEELRTKFLTTVRAKPTDWKQVEAHHSLIGGHTLVKPRFDWFSPLRRKTYTPEGFFES